MTERRLRLSLWFVLALVAAAYAGLGFAGYVWDDRALLQHNEALDAPTFENVFRRDIWCCTGTTNTGYYRPLLTVTFLVDRWLFGMTPGGAHLHSLLWHLAAVGAVAGLLRGRVGPERAAVAALIFGLHPIQSEAVVWISARNDLMAAAGVLATLWALDRGRAAPAALLAFAACLCKENAFLLPAVAWLWRRAWGERLGRRDLVALGVGIGAALAVRSQATLGGMGLGDADLGFNAWSALRGALEVSGWVVWPWPLTSTASLYLPPPTPVDWLAAAGTVALLVTLLRVGGWRSAWLLAIGALLLAPSALGVRWYGNIGERYLYLPVFGVAAALVSLPSLPRRAVAAGLTVVATVMALAALYVRVPEWANEESLFTAAVRRVPDSYAWNQLGVELHRQHREAEAVAAFDAAIARTPLQRRACQHVVPLADQLMDDAALVARGRFWSERGCVGSLTFNGTLALALASRGEWEEASAVVGRMHRSDPGRRDQIVLAALAERDGDVDALSSLAIDWPDGPSRLLDQVSYLTQHVR